jgi:prepilin-type N-terminal cleavage/methylation domain-containing protein
MTRADRSHCRERQPKALRRGFTFVEMLVTMAVVSMVFATVVVVVALLWRAHDNVRDESARSAAVARLVAQLRADAHVADTATLVSADGETQNLLQLRSGTSRVEYRRDAERMIRTAFENDRAVHREVFWLGVAYFDPRLGDSAPATHREQLETVIGLVAGGRP